MVDLHISHHDENPFEQSHEGVQPGEYEISLLDDETEENTTHDLSTSNVRAAERKSFSHKP